MLSASGAGIHVYDINTYQKLGSIPTPAYTFGHPGWYETRIVRWGEDGLAFLGKEGVFLVRSPIVAR
jgi:hypothetical protein